jgi:hypothetical protein
VFDSDHPGGSSAPDSAQPTSPLVHTCAIEIVGAGSFAPAADVALL